MVWKETLSSDILECLAVMLMYMFQRKIGVSWIINAEKCIFIGYKDGVKGYKLWNPETKKTVYSRDVAFQRGKRCVQTGIPTNARRT
jgi:hypothetical protein